MNIIQTLALSLLLLANSPKPGSVRHSESVAVLQKWWGGFTPLFFATLALYSGLAREKPLISLVGIKWATIWSWSYSTRTRQVIRAASIIMCTHEAAWCGITVITPNAQSDNACILRLNSCPHPNQFISNTVLNLFRSWTKDISQQRLRHLLSWRWCSDKEEQDGGILDVHGCRWVLLLGWMREMDFVLTKRWCAGLVAG